MGKLRFGVLGAAKIAREKVIPPLMRSQRCEVVALASRDAARAAEVAGQLGIARSYGSYEDLLADPELARRFPGDTPVPGRESREEVAARAMPALLELAERHPDQAIIVVGHGGFIRAVLGVVDPHGTHGMITNGSVHSLRHGNGTFSLIAFDLKKRKDRVRERAADDDDVLALPAPGDLGLALVKAEYRTAVAGALREAARELAPGDRHLLRQHLVEHHTIDQLAAVLGIHRATAARRITRATEELAALTRRRLADQLAVSAAELDDIVALVWSQLEVSLGGLLATPTPR